MCSCYWSCKIQVGSRIIVKICNPAEGDGKSAEVAVDGDEGDGPLEAGAERRRHGPQRPGQDSELRAECRHAEQVQALV